MSCGEDVDVICYQVRGLGAVGLRTGFVESLHEATSMVEIMEK